MNPTENTTLIACPACGHMLSPAAPTCPQCGRPLAQATPTPEQDAPVKKRLAFGDLCLLILLGLLVLVGLANILTVPPVATPVKGGKPTASAVPTLARLASKTDASLMCQTFVQRRLRAPATAKFPPVTEDKVTKYGPNTFMVSSYVDSQNGFGALIRSTYTCEMTVSGDSWTPVSIDIASI